MSTEHLVNRIEGIHERPCTLVWIDGDLAVLVRWRDREAEVERVESEVPAHHRAIGHVRHDPAVRHGGGGPQDAGESRRLEHLRRFIHDVGDRVAPGDDLLIVGPGVVHDRLARHLADGDRRRASQRQITCEAAPPLSDRQLVERLRRFAGDEPRRRTVGAHRWSGPAAVRPSGRAEVPPRPVSVRTSRGRPRDATRD